MVALFAFTKIAGYACGLAVGVGRGWLEMQPDASALAGALSYGAAWQLVVTGIAGCVRTGGRGSARRKSAMAQALVYERCWR